MSYHNYDRRSPPHYPPSQIHHTTTYTTYADTPSSNYFARLAEKAAPSGTIHLNSYESASEYGRQPVYYTRPPSPQRVLREVVTVREPAAQEPERVERVERVVREREREVVHEPERRRQSGKKEDEERGGLVRGAAGKGVGAIWKALGGR